MNFASAATPSPVSFRSGRGLNANSAQLPFGQFSFGNCGLVIPISCRYASPATRSADCGNRVTLDARTPIEHGTESILCAFDVGEFTAACVEIRKLHRCESG